MGFWSSLTSILTGGASTLANKVAEQVTGNDTTLRVLDQFNQAISTAGIADMGNAIENGGSLYDVVDRAIDPGGTIDTGTRALGEELPENVRSVAPALGAAIASYVGGPLYAGAGYGVGSKLAGQDTESGMKGAALATAMAYAGSELGDLMSGTGGAEYGNISDAELAAYEAEATDMASQGITDGMGAAMPYSTGGNLPTTFEPVGGSAAYGDISDAELTDYATEEAKMLKEGITSGSGKPMPYSNPNANLLYKPTDWKSIMKTASKLSQILSGSPTGFEAGPTSTSPGKGSPDIGMLSELMGRGKGKRSNITSGEAEGPTYGTTVVQQNEMEKSTPGLYYS